MIKERNYALDMMKAMAAIMITNSHFIPLYKDVNVSLATLGVHGNALFFFVSGYLLTMGLTRKEERFDHWYKHRINRLLPALLLWYLVVMDHIGGGGFISSIWSNYWFINCIIIYYALFYFVVDFITKHKDSIGWFLYDTFLAIAVIMAFYMPKAEGSLFHTDWHYICHFSVMILGGITYKYQKKEICHNRKTDWIWLLISFVAYFVIMKLGKGHTDWTYYLQILCLIPLHLFCYYCFKAFSGNWCTKLFVTKGVRWPFIALSCLTLEIYIVQFVIITDKFNSIFPLSLVIVFTFITLVAYVLRIASNLFTQLMSKDPWQWKDAMKIS